MNTRYETMKKHAKSLTDLVGSLVEDNRCKYGDEENEKRRKKTKTYAYMWIHPHWAGVTRILGNLPAEKTLFDITRIPSKSRALKVLSTKYQTFYKTLTPYFNLKLWHITYVQITTKSTKSNLLSWPKIFVLKFILFYKCQ